MLPIHSILCPTDFSRPASYALPLAKALARDYGARLVLLHVIQPDPLPVMGEFGAVPPEPAPDKAALRKRLIAMVPENPASEVLAVVAEGDPATEILRAAQQHKSDLIVLGTHGRTGLGRVLMGSVAETVTRKATCPVLTLKSPIVETSVGPAGEKAVAKV